MNQKSRSGMRRNTALGVCASTLVAMTASGASAYGGEDVLNGYPWHHLDNTLRALAGDANAGAQTQKNVVQGVGFTRDAAMSVAWHADYIDSYLYNPLFWAEGGPGSKRTKAALVGFENLAKLHHDDTFTTSGVIDNWERYAAGTLAGLYWASTLDEDEGVAAAHNILGVSVHALQDFYSHSNWMDDPARREKTFLEYTRNDRSQLSLFTGAYEEAATQAPAHHGAYSLSCSLLSGNISDTLSSLCGGLSPIQNLSLCEEYRACRGSTPVTVSVSGIAPGNVVYLNPRGIALDTTWLTEVDAIERGLTNAAGKYRPGKASPNMSREDCNAYINYGVKCDHKRSGEPCSRIASARQCRDPNANDSDYLFAASKKLAIRSTEQWILKIEQAMKEMGSREETFWNKVKTQKSSVDDREAQFEDFNRLPFQFLSAGPYPVANAGHSASSSHGYYLRLQIETSSDSLAGTDADIVAIARRDGQSRSYLLDYLPTSDTQGRTDNRFLVYNDFEQGDNDAYVIGPMPFRPETVELVNKSANAGESAEALWTDFKSGVDHALTDIRRGLLSIIAGNADYVGTQTYYGTRADIVRDLAGVSGGVRTRAMTISAGDEGSYRLYYTSREVNSGLTATQRAQGWKAFEYAVTKLSCIREAKVDRGSNSDEPFFFFSIAPLNGLSSTRVFGYRKGPFSDVDSGEERSATSSNGSHKTIVKLPPNGGIAMSFQLFESDDENSNDRNQLYQTFITGLDEETRRGNSEFIDTVGAAVAADWKVDKVSAFLFKRGPVPEAKKVLNPSNMGWLEGGERKTFRLNTTPMKQLTKQAGYAVSNWHVPNRTIDYSDLVDSPIVKSPTMTDPVIMPKQSPAIAIPELSPDIANAAKPPAWQGTWNTSFGEIRLLQDGARVYGDYGGRGIIDGQYNAKTKIVSGRFTNGDREGRFQFRLNGASFSGKWRWASDRDWQGDWAGTRTSSAKPRLTSKF